MKMTNEQIEKLKKAQSLISDVYHEAIECSATETAWVLSSADSCIVEALDFVDENY
jgi:hypothetical protein